MEEKSTKEKDRKNQENRAKNRENKAKDPETKAKDPETKAKDPETKAKDPENKAKTQEKAKDQENKAKAQEKAKDQENKAKAQEKAKNQENNDKTTQSTEETKKQNKAVWVTRDMAEEIGREEILRTTFNEFLIYGIFVVLMTLYITGTYNRKSYYLTRGLNEQFTQREFHTVNDADATFEGISTATDFWFYTDALMIDSFFWEHTYSSGTVDENAMNILGENKMLGVPRIRQVKVRNDSCVVHEYFRRLFLSCYDAYSDAAEDKETFGPGNSSAWVHSTPEQTKSRSFWGKVSTYGRGGFYADFPKNRQQTFDLFHELKDNLWITRGTRAIFVDFSLYNANQNIFAVCKLVFEFPSTGGIISSTDFRSIGLLRLRTTFDWFVLVCECICYGFLAFYILEEAREIMYFKLKYFKKFWNYIDFGILVLTSITAVISIMKMLLIKGEINEILENQDKYGNLEYMAWLHSLYNHLIAVDLFFIYMKILKFFNFSKTMGQLNNTMSRCARDIIGFSIMFFIIFFAFAELGYLLFGSQVESFSSFGVAMFTLLRTILGDFNYQEIESANRILAPVYFLSYIFLVFFVLLNMFLAIINDTYADVKTEIAIAPDEMQMREYLSIRARKLLRKLGCKCLAEKSEAKSEINATLRQIRDALKKCGFGDLEIEMFFARYNIDPLAEISVADVDKLVDELEGILRDGDIKDGTTYVQLKDFVGQQERLEQMDKTIGDLVEHVKVLLLQLEKIDNVRVNKPYK